MTDIPGIDNNAAAQLALVKDLAVFYRDFPFTPAQSNGLESYLLKAFLQFNASFKILLFNSYLALHIVMFLRVIFRSRNKTLQSLWIAKI